MGQTSSSETKSIKWYSKSIIRDKLSLEHIVGWSSSVTYSCAEAAMYFLHDCISVSLNPDAQQEAKMRQSLDEIIAGGMAMDPKMGHAKLGEVLQNQKHLQEQFEILATANGTISNKQEINNILSSLEEAIGQAANKVHKQGAVAVITKTPESLVVYYCPGNFYSWAIYDPQERTFEKEKGFGFYFFITKADVADHIKELLADYAYDDSYEVSFMTLKKTATYCPTKRESSSLGTRSPAKRAEPVEHKHSPIPERYSNRTEHGRESSISQSPRKPSPTKSATSDYYASPQRTTTSSTMATRSPAVIRTIQNSPRKGEPEIPEAVSKDIEQLYINQQLMERKIEMLELENDLLKNQFATSQQELALVKTKLMKLELNASQSQSEQRSAQKEAEIRQRSPVAQRIVSLPTPSTPPLQYRSQSRGSPSVPLSSQSPRSSASPTRVSRPHQ